MAAALPHSHLPDILLGMNVVVDIAAAGPDAAATLCGDGAVGGISAQVVERIDGGASYVVCRNGARAVVPAGCVETVPCAHCGADLAMLRGLLADEERKRRGLEEDVARYKTVAGVYESDAQAMRGELRRIEKELDDALRAASKRSNRLEARFNKLVAERIAGVDVDAGDTVAAAADGSAAEAAHRAQKAEHNLGRAKTTLRAVADAGYAAVLAARTAFEKLCEVSREVEDYIDLTSAAGDLLPVMECLSTALVQVDSSHDWAAQVCELAGRPRPAGLPPPPPPLPPRMVGYDDPPGISPEIPTPERDEHVGDGSFATDHDPLDFSL